MSTDVYATIPEAKSLRPISTRVLWTLNMLTCHCIDEERDDKSFMGVEIVSRK
jgi:hypothetical protein